MNILHTHIIQLIVFITVSTSSTVSAQVEAYLPFTQAEFIQPVSITVSWHD